MVHKDTRIALESSFQESVRYFAGIVDTGIADTGIVDTSIVDTDFVETIRC